MGFYFLNTNIRYLRKKRKMTVPELADELELSGSSLAHIEGCQKNTSLEVLDKLHRIFNISTDDLIYKDLSNDSED